MIQYPSDNLIRFLQATDQYLEAPQSIIVIGGAAALLHHHAVRPTTDIDTISPIPEELEKAFSHARRVTGLDIPVTTVGVFDGPYEYEDRLEHLGVLGFRHLSLWVPERHDLVLMKVVRGYDHDIQVIEQMHQAVPLDLDTLTVRYEVEMTHIIGQPAVLQLSFLLLVERLFGKKAAKRLEHRWPERGR